MAESLQRKIDLLRHRLRRRLLLYGMGSTLAAGLGLALGLAMLDYLVRPEDPGLRVLASIALAVGIGWVAYRCLYRPLTVPLDDVELARRIERCFPALRDRLASAADFLRHDGRDPRAGSPALQRAAIQSATTDAQSLDFTTVIEPRPARRAMILAGVTMLVVAIVCVGNPLVASIAAARLFDPLSPRPWPRRTHLELRDSVSRVARDQAFEVTVVDRFGERLPRQVWFEYRPLSEGEPSPIQRELMRPRPNDDTESRFLRRERVTQPFSYRVVGGDDDSMRWIHVEVLDPPRVVECRLHVEPPPYTGWPSVTETRQLGALAGSRLSVAGKSSEPLRAARLHGFEPGPRAAMIDDKGLNFTFPRPDDGPLLLRRSREARLGLVGRCSRGGVDQRGLHNPDAYRFHVRVIDDAAPNPRLIEPPHGRFVTADAVVPVRVEAEDDLAVKRIRLLYGPPDAVASGKTPGGDGPPDAASSEAIESTDAVPRGALVLWDDPAPHPPEPRGGRGPDHHGEQRSAEAVWTLSSLALRPGMRLAIVASATDYAGQTGTSVPVELSIVSREQLRRRLAADENALLDDLQRLAGLQADARRQVESVRQARSDPPRPDEARVDLLQSAELTQQQVQAGLVGPDRGLAARLDNLLAQVDDNRLAAGELQRRARRLRAMIDQLQREHLEVIANELSVAMKAVPSGTLPADHLASAAAHQQAVLDSLREAIASLRRWEDISTIRQELADLWRDELDLIDTAGGLSRATLGRRRDSLSPDQRAKLDTLAARQWELVHRLDRLRDAMTESAQRLGPADPQAAQLVRRGADQLRYAAPGVSMRAAAEAVGDNRMAEALAELRASAQRLRQALDQMTPGNQTPGQPAAAPDEVTINAADLRRIKAEQQQIRAETARLRTEAGQQPLSVEQRDRLAELVRRQRALADQFVTLFTPDRPPGSTRPDARPSDQPADTSPRQPESPTGLDQLLPEPQEDQP